MKHQPSVSVAIVGAGYIADFHVRALRRIEGVEVTAIVDSDITRARRFAANVSVAGAATSVAGLERSVDVIHVLTPPQLHEEIAVAALGAGMDVLLEKPLCVTSAACERVMAAARLGSQRGGAPRLVGCSQNFLCALPFQQLRKDVDSGVLGRIESIDIVWHKPFPQFHVGPFRGWLFAKPTNVLFEVGPHSFAHGAVLAGPPDRIEVLAFDPTELGGDADHVGYQGFEISTRAGDCSVRYRFSFVDAFTEHFIRVRGTAGVAVCDFEASTYVLTQPQARQMDVERWASVVGGATSAVKQATEVFSKTLLGTMQFAPGAAPFADSIARAVAAFYRGRQTGVLDDTVAPETATAAVRIAEDVERAFERTHAPASVPRSVPSRGARIVSVVKDARPNAAAPVLVTGGTGFIGKVLVEHLRRQHIRVRALVRSPHAVPSSWLSDSDPVEIVVGDMANRDALQRAVAGAARVIHLARGQGNTYAQYVEADLNPTLMLAELALQEKVQRFVYVSSTAVYEAIAAGTIDEATPAKAEEPYGRSKIACERQLAQTTLPLVIVRPGVVLGVGASPLHWGVAAWPHPTVAKLYGDGSQLLPIVLVDDCADAIIKATFSLQAVGSYNLVGPPLVSAREYIDAVESVARIGIRQLQNDVNATLLEGMLKWAVKRASGNRDAVKPSRNGVRGKAFHATFASTKAQHDLDWHPSADKATILQRGVIEPTTAWYVRPRARTTSTS